MYNPPHFKVEDEAKITSFIAQNPFATLISHGSKGLFASHLPLFYKDDVFYGHLAKANPHETLHEGEALIIMQGLHEYITPNFYPSKQENHKVVPTWNYVTLHVWGELSFHHDDETKLWLVSKLTNMQETKEPMPWAVNDAPSDFIKGQLKGIYGITFKPSRMSFKEKLSQNRNQADYEGVKQRLLERNPKMSAMMQK